MKVLYIGENIRKSQNGGDVVSKRNIDLLRSVFKDDFHIYHIKCISSIKTFRDSLMGYMNGLSVIHVYNIVRLVRSEKFGIVCLASSKMGKLAKILKKQIPSIIIVTFYHNVEKQYMNEECRVSGGLKNYYLRFIVSYNERLATKWSDKLILLNERDKLLLEKIYNRTADLILPITFSDYYNIDEVAKSRKTIDGSLQLLFVGYAFFANIEGAKWFIDNVLPYLNDVKLTIVGKGMDKHFVTRDNINVIGFVDDLSHCYYNCDLIISPILSGGGMKTKTAEALMYGCPIVGTSESFEGYNFDKNLIGGCVDSSQSMISLINKIEKERDCLMEYRNNAREIFLKFYSHAKGEEVLFDFLSKMICNINKQ